MIAKVRQFLRVSRKDLLIAVIPAALFALLAFVLAYHYIDPSPPDRLVISTGLEEGDYQSFAEHYRDILRRDGIRLEIVKSAGAVENLARLKDEKSGVDVGFVQGGLHDEEDREHELETLGSVSYEPVWVFYRGKETLTRLAQLKGKRVSIGREGGGTRRIALQLLQNSGLGEAEIKLLSLPSAEGAKALAGGEIDAAVFLATAETDFIQQLLFDPALRLMSLEHANAYARRLPFLHHLVLPQGAIDIQRNIPAQEVHMIGPTAQLVVRDSLHPALKYLLLKAASETHNDPGLFQRKNQFPADKDVDFPLSDEAQHYYKSGPPFLQRYLPFWVATLIDRMIFVLVPILAFLIPLTRIIPALYAWRIKSRIYRWYGELKFLETQIDADRNPADAGKFFEKLEWIESRANSLRLPLAFSEHLYVLREHIDLVRRKIAKLSGAVSAGAAK